MAKRKPDTGAIYISPRLRASLEPVGRCALTVVTAPMGYGKTTAVNWFLGTQPPGCAIRISIYSDSLPVLWQSGRRAFRDAGLTALEGFECPGTRPPPVCWPTPCAGSCGGRSHGMCFWTTCT